MSLSIKCVVVDDEPLAREGLINYIQQLDFLELVGTAENPVKLSELMEKVEVDLLFLDIQMPLMNGIDYLKVTKRRPLVILTTAFPNYALESYSLEVLDYMLKPITFDRFFQGAKKAKDYFSTSSSGDSSVAVPDYFFVKSNQIFERIYFKDVLFVQAHENYIMLHTTNSKHMVLMPMKRIEELLGDSFLRVHNSYIIAQDKVSSVERDKVLIHDQEIPVSRNYRAKVMELVVGDKLWKK